MDPNVTGMPGLGLFEGFSAPPIQKIVVNEEKTLKNPEKFGCDVSQGNAGGIALGFRGEP
jgi:hypothetical protein